MTGGEQTTLARPVSKRGVGLHTGMESSVTLRPAEANAGIVFVSGAEIPARAEHVVGTDRGTTLGLGEARVQTVEHLLAAIYGMGVDNVRVEVEGPEVPACDGSAREWVALLEQAGRRSQGQRRARGELRESVWVVEEGYWAMALPAERLGIAVGIDFPGTVVGRQAVWVELSAGRFAEELAPARTFAFLEELEGLRAAGLAKGGGAENAFGIGPEGYSGPLRFPDEVVRHKALDLVGDLALCGSRLAAQVIAVRPSHRGNVALARALAAALGG